MVVVEFMLAVLSSAAKYATLHGRRSRLWACYLHVHRGWRAVKSKGMSICSYQSAIYISTCVAMMKFDFEEEVGWTTYCFAAAALDVIFLGSEMPFVTFYGKQFFILWGQRHRNGVCLSRNLEKHSVSEFAVRPRSSLDSNAGLPICSRVMYLLFVRSCWRKEKATYPCRYLRFRFPK